VSVDSELRTSLIAQHYAVAPCATIAVLMYRVGIARVCVDLWKSNEERFDHALIGAPGE
jgi:hypothetical protein